ncbi:GNAT family N-acetyltransferase [Klebsiella pneumoniae]
MTVEYTVIEKVPSAEAFCHLRVAAGMSPRPLEGARAGLPHSCYGVHILWQETPIAMGRIVGDGAINFDIVDVAVDPAHQGKGLGRLVADVPELYAKFGFESVRPESEGMARVWRTRSR